MWALVLYLLLALAVAWFGTDRKFGFWGYLLAALFLTPLIGALLVLGSDPRRPRPRHVRYEDCPCRDEI